MLIVSCGKKELNSIVIPADEATDAEKEILFKALDRIQDEFDGIGVSVNLRSIPYHVATLDSSLAGYCAYRADGSPIGIAINHSVFNYWGSETELHYGPIYKVLLHEIGHCFFGRDHDQEMFSVPGHELGLQLLAGHPEEIRSELELSAMKDYAEPFTAKALWPYYIKEIAGQDRITSLADLRRYVEVTLVP